MASRDRVREINLAGVRIARQCVAQIAQKQASEAFVAGAIGPLGVPLAPKGELSLDQARAAFAEQIAALAEGGPGVGADLLIVETMTSLAEAGEAIRAAREVAPGLRIVVMMTVDEDGNCLDGATPEIAAERLTKWGADVIGCNCSDGPATVLTVIERMRLATRLPLAAMPNAGLPRAVEGRNIYMASPEYMASFARKFIHAGASLIGGCCGTTPNHIRAMKSAMRALQAQEDSARRDAAGLGAAGHESAAAGQSSLQADSEAAVEAAGPSYRPKPIVSQVEPLPLAQRSRVGALIASGQFCTLVEIVPPKGIDCTKEIEGAALLHKLGVHAINVPDSPRASARMSAQSLCIQIQQKVGIETVLHYTCRDRNLLSIQSDLIGASSIGLKNILCLTGDPPKMGNYPDATAVFDVDAIGLTGIVRNLNYGLDLGTNPIGASTGFTLACAANPGFPDIDYEVRRFARKVEAGAEYAITQPVFDLRLLEQFLRRIEAIPHPAHRGHLAAHQPAQRRVPQERPEDLHARRNPRPHGRRQYARGRARRGNSHCAGDASPGANHGTGLPGQRALRKIHRRRPGPRPGVADFESNGREQTAMANFEEHLTQLEKVVEKLERGDLSLDESVRLFEDGMKLSGACKKELEQAEGRIQVLVEGKAGKLQPADLDLQPAGTGDAGGDGAGDQE